MRITMNTMYNQINTDLSRLVEKQAQTNASISSGKIYRRPSDEPVALTHALNIRNSISETDQFKKNIKYGQGWVRATETAMTQIQDRVMRAKTLAVKAANDSQNAESRDAIASEIQAILKEVVALGNTKMGNRYVLAGTRTKDYGPDEAPFVLNGDGSVTYNGNREDLNISVASGIRQKINLDGHTAMVQSGIFEALDLLYDSLKSNNQQDIEAALGDIDQGLEYVNQQVSQLGALANSLDNKNEMALSLNLTNKERLSDIEDTDIIEAINNLKAQEVSYQAALAAASKVMNLSLVDYIR